MNENVENFVSIWNIPVSRPASRQFVKNSATKHQKHLMMQKSAKKDVDTMEKVGLRIRC
jgi:hypothetical protein